MDHVQRDFMIAKQLQEQFDKELVEISSEDEDVSGSVHTIDIKQKHQKIKELHADHATETIQLWSDSDDEVMLQTVDRKQTISTTNNDNNIQLITGQTTSQSKVIEKTVTHLKAKEYFIEDLQMYVNPEYNFDWKFIDILPHIGSIFVKFDTIFFQSRLQKANINISWSDCMGRTCTNRNFNGSDRKYYIVLNGPLLSLRPRIEIISIILHEMIHALLKIEGVNEANGGHGKNFHKIMTFLNRMIQTNISFNHEQNNVDQTCRGQWYRCSGICHNYDPFHGIVRSVAGPPGLHNEWWKEHADICGGTFYKIFEMSKMVQNDISVRYAVNVKYMVPKQENISRRYYTKLPPTESIDLTSNVPKVSSIADAGIIVVDTYELDDNETHKTVVANKFIENFIRTIPFTRDAYEMQCPICQTRIKRNLFTNHIDGCKGFIQHVAWKKSSGGNIVQNGLLELNSTSRMQSSSSVSRSPIPFYPSYQQTRRQRFG
ncbi:uncharacterized protein LOC128721101 [Anopheles nili]|uniref:uncharacterized protein LOC128721101 n=1 Tax=Anopheles nili TaxID=185578 RepID=UPI00237BBD82|nr:uncharacterized protein LOC128721101 [Anopheles nili]